MANDRTRIVASVCAAVAVALPVLWLGLAAEAANGYARYSRKCANLEYRETHHRWCAIVYRLTHMVPRTHRYARVEFPPVQSYEANVTVYRDRQAPVSVSGPADRYIALQTADDVARSPAFGLFLGWVPGIFDMGPKYVPVPSRVVEQPRSSARTRQVVDCVRQAFPQC